MFELLFLGGILLVGVLMLKLVFGILGFAFHLVMLPVKIIVGLVFGLLLLPLLLLALPVFVVGVIGVGFLVVGAALSVIFGLFSAV